jgi:hypothetical protein
MITNEHIYAEKIYEPIKNALRQYEAINYIGATIVKKPLYNVLQDDLVKFFESDLAEFELPTTIKNVLFKLIKSSDMITVIASNKNGTIINFTDKMVIDKDIIIKNIQSIAEQLITNNPNTQNKSSSLPRLGYYFYFTFMKLYYGFGYV